MVVAYSYMALVPIIQPLVIKGITTKKERMIRMKYAPSSVSKTTKILFPIIVTLVAGLIAPQSLALVGFLMLGNLIRECGVLNSLPKRHKRYFQISSPFSWVLPLRSECRRMNSCRSIRFSSWVLVCLRSFLIPRAVFCLQS